ncbi:unnamed protein product [Heligmosomoides polygyrus]|uniref:Uncharacterized protein n=1 Tax=Heligmosomoides polygyrus TaxID=6339 RepID=A0A3P8CWF0_HELPZ|nr:unnamed protein product [Heligmosomoides polygyrus]
MENPQCQLVQLTQLMGDSTSPSSPNAAIQKNTNDHSAELDEEEEVAAAVPRLTFSFSDVQPVDDDLFRVETANGVVDLRKFAPVPVPFYYEPPPPPTIKDLVMICDEHGHEI